jgi:hypothetical protein
MAIGGLPPTQPSAETSLPLTVAIPEGFRAADGVPTVPFENNTLPGAWLVAGPFKPKSMDTDFLAPIGGHAAARPFPGLTVKCGATEVPFRLMDPAHTWRDAKFTAGMSSLKIGPALGGQWDSSVYYYTVISNDALRVVEARILSPGGVQWNGPERLRAAIWIGATKVSEEKLYRIPKGHVPVLVQASVGALTGGGNIWMAPRLADRTPEVSRQISAYEEQSAAWAAFQAEKDTPFVLAPIPAP